MDRCLQGFKNYDVIIQKNMWLYITAPNKSRYMWNIIKNNTNHNKQKTNDVQSLNINNTIVTNPEQIAKAFIKFFIDTPLLINQSLPPVKKENTVFYCNTASIFLNPVWIFDIINIKDSLKTSKSTGPHIVATILIKAAKIQIPEVLTHIINNSFKHGIFPNILKLSKIIPVYKNGEENLIDNYRPVDLQSVISKIIEKAILTRIINFLNNSKIISENQHGFTKDKPAITALTAFINEVYSNLDDGNKILASYADLSSIRLCGSWYPTKQTWTT